MTKPLTDAQKILRKVIRWYREHGEASWYRGGKFFETMPDEGGKANTACGCVMGITAKMLRPDNPWTVVAGEVRDLDALRRYVAVKCLIADHIPDEFPGRDQVYNWNDRHAMSFNEFLATLERAAQ